jgi:uracil-DNA glycosylase
LNFKLLGQQIESCRLCPRLVENRESLPPKKQFASCPYWRKPVAGFGDEEAQVLILGLAPSADGANRTGRIFTGDPSAKFLMRALYETGFANQPDSIDRNDGLILKNAYMTPVVKCVPPKHMPTAKEIETCRQYLIQELHLLTKLRAVVALGGVAFNAYLHVIQKKASFSHGAIVRFNGLPTLFGCYHPSPQNTNTGRLTLDMMKQVLVNARVE